MSTAAQINANQLNSQKSTGPTSTVGKENSSQNRRTHGLGGKFTVLASENQAEFEALLQHFDNDYKPSVASETALVERMAESCWLTERALRLQNTCFDPNTGEIADEKKFALYQRHRRVTLLPLMSSAQLVGRNSGLLRDLPVPPSTFYISMNYDDEKGDTPGVLPVCQ